MRKKVLAATLLATSLFAWVGCDETEKQSSLDFGSITDSVTICGTAVFSTGVDVNSSNYSIVVEKPAAGRNVFVEVDNSQYVPGTAGVLIYQTITDEKGYFSIDVPTIKSGINATLRFEEFTDYYNEYDKMEAGKPVFTTRLNKYDYTLALFGLKPGATEFTEKCLYDRTVIDLEQFDETVVLKGNVQLAVERGYLDGIFTPAKSSDVEFEITYDKGTSAAMTLTFGVTTDTAGNYSLKVPAKSLAAGFEVTNIKVKGIGDNAYTHYTNEDGSYITLSGAYQLQNIVSSVSMGDIIGGMDYNLGKKYLYFTPNYNAGLTPTSEPATWHDKLAGWAIGNGKFDDSYVSTIELTGRILLAEQTAYATGDFAGSKQVIKIYGDNAPYNETMIAITDEDGNFSIEIPVQDASIKPSVDFALELDNSEIPFTFYQKDGKTKQLRDGYYTNNYINIKAEDAEWFELGDFYFNYQPHYSNTPDDWSKDLVGWKVFDGYDYTAEIKGSLFFAQETSFATGKYQPAANELAQVTVSYSGAIGAQSFVVPVKADGSFNFNIPLKDEKDQPAVAFATNSYSTNEFVHYTTFGKEDTRLLKGDYSLYNNGAEDVIVKDEDAEWNVLGAYYYKFAPTGSVPSTWHENLAGWYKKLEFDKTETASGTAFFAVETAYAVGGYDPAVGEVVTVSVNAPYTAKLQVPVASSGKFSVNIPIKNVGDECSLSTNSASVEVKNFKHYTTGGEKTTRILEGKYDPGFTIKSEDAIWNELGTIYYSFTPDAGYKPEQWDNYFKYLAGWQKKAGFEQKETVTGSVFYPVENAFYKGAYEGKPYHFVKFTGISDMTFVGVTNADGEFSIPVVLQFADDTPTLLWDNASISTDVVGTFKHFRKAGNETTVSWKGSYSVNKDVKSSSAAWKELGIRYYSFTPDYTEGYDITSAEWAYYKKLAGWRVANSEETTTINITGTIKRAYQKKNGDWEAAWENAKNQRATISIAGEQLEVITNGSGAYSFSMKVQEAEDNYTINVSPREEEGVFIHHVEPDKAASTNVAGKYVDYGAVVNTFVVPKSSGSTYKVTDIGDSRVSAKMSFVPTTTPTGWALYSWDPSVD